MNHANDGSEAALPTLDRGQTHVWFLHTESALPTPILTGRDWLSADEIQRAARFAFDHDRQQFVASRVVLRRVLSEYAAVDPVDWKFAAGPWGKPFVDTPAQARWLQFNLTHTRGLVVVAVTREHEVGVDAEWVGRTVEWQTIAASYFAPREMDDLQSVTADHSHDRFLRLWTLKEACIKAFGQGLTIPLNAVCFDSLDHQPRLQSNAQLPVNPIEWDVHVLHGFADHRVAVAVRHAENGQLTTLNAMQLLH